MRKHGRQKRERVALVEQEIYQSMRDARWPKVEFADFNCRCVIGTIK